MKFLILFFIISTNVFASSWEKIKEEDGIQIFKRDLPNTSLISFRGVGIVDAPVEKIVSIILDTGRAAEWAADLEESKVLEWKNQPMEYIEYNHIRMPLILSNRDFISNLKVSVDKNKKQVHVQYSTPNEQKYLKPYYDGNVLGDLDGSYFTLTSVNGGASTQLDGVVVCDPKGVLPNWVVNLFQSSWPYDTIQSIRKQASKPDVTVLSNYSKILK